MEDSADLTQIARKYLDLWLEHWASSLNAPETIEMMARLMSALAPKSGDEIAGVDGDAGGIGAWPKSAALRTAPNAGGGGAPEFEERLAALEQRLAELELSVNLAGHSRRTGRSAPKV